MASVVHIPKSVLRQQLDEAARIKDEMQAQLLQLEESASGKRVEHTGTWRHDTGAWIGRRS